MSDEFIQKLDFTGLECPMPLLKMKLALKEIEPGQMIYIEASDSGSWRDFHKFAEITKNELVRAEKSGDIYCYVIKKGS